MRPVKGFLADDGTFFETAEDVELYDAMHSVKFAVETKCGANPQSVFKLLDTCAVEIRRYLDAKDSQSKSEDELPNWNEAKRRNDPTAPSVDNADDSRTDAYTPVFKQSPNRDEPMPDVGRCICTEALCDDCPVHGFGGGGSDASSVCSDTDMAALQAYEFTNTRPESS